MSGPLGFAAVRLRRWASPGGGYAMNDDRIKLTRRKILAATGTVGVAGVGAGLGTSALFSDREAFGNNTFTAGTLDMSVTATVEGANEYWASKVDDDTTYGPAINGLSETADGGVTAGLSVDDVKPGDWAIIRFDIEVEDNPAYVQTVTSGLVSNENGFEEPEPTDDTPNEGELEDEMLAVVYGGLSGAGVASNNAANPPYSYLNNSSRDPTTPSDSTVQETYDTYSTGVLLRDGSGDPLEVSTGDDAATWYLLLHLPKAVGNVVQGDGFEFDLEFHAEQARHNDDPFSDDSGTTQQSVDLTVDGTTHDLDITVGSEDDGEALTQIWVDYGATGTLASGTSAYDIDLLLEGTDISGDITGVDNDNGGERVNISLDGSTTLSASDHIDLTLDDIPNTASGSAEVSLNGDGVTTVNWGGT